MIRYPIFILVLCLYAPVFGQELTLLQSFSAAEKALEEKDYSTAFRLFKPLAEQGNSEAQANLALMYEHGRGVKKDLVEAFKWHSLAANQGLAWAQTNLGIAYANGRGVEQNDQEAVKWFRSAALKGKIRAQELLASMYDRGRGAPQNQMSAAQWINPSNLMYIAELAKDYGDMVHFETRDAEEIVRNFDIKCNSRMDDRYLPLFNIILARLPSQNGNEIKTNTFVLERDGEVRIVDSHELSNGRSFETVVFQINKWGELIPMGGITSSAVLNACFSSFGPIWLIE
ncbi:tetratricopeptide repeat protein [Vreelandella lionensis]|uniref:tetratricopeptide repeat protein n=1 Tax=Halomonadaceae TaxID=28256 RepID=UPI00111C0A7B|nr:tetratricopeptide repeat protein [Halomonas lionensis]MCP1318389.1 sel1 repeat family protein [Halomonas sp. 707B3]